MIEESLLKEALELIWLMENGFHKQKEAKEFMKKCNFDWYNKDNWKLNGK